MVPANQSNHALELTAARTAFGLFIIKTFSARLTFGVGSRRSAHSR
jgi:hypothetical protein